MEENWVLDKIIRAFPQGSDPQERLALGIGDDAALLKPLADSEIILTCDWFLQGTHFLLAKHPPASVGWKCLARAISDIAAMGGSPECFLLSLGLPESATGRWLDGFLRGLTSASLKLGCNLAGGDTTHSNKIAINVTVVGRVKQGRALLRTGARPGDVIFVSGKLGAAELGLRCLRTDKVVNDGDSRLLRHLYPVPRLEFGQWLSEKRIASAAMDLSDGLSTDLARLCRASNVGAVLNAPLVLSAAVPVTGEKNQHRRLEWALHGGDDYELLFTVPQSRAKRISSVFNGLPVTAIGRIVAEKMLTLSDRGQNTPLTPGGWDPFRTGRK